MKETDKVFPLESEYSTESGISVRDYVAIQAMMGLSANPSLTTRGFDEIADMAYIQADEMIKRSEK
jgi:hypothetical protein